MVQLVDTIRAAREKNFITLVRDRAPYADFMQNRAALSVPAERSPSRKFRRNLDGVIEHVPFRPTYTYFFVAVVAAVADTGPSERPARMRLDEGQRVFRRDTHRWATAKSRGEPDRTGSVDVDRTRSIGITFLRETCEDA